MSNLGERIKYYRILRKMKQEDLANLLGKSKNVVSNWERGDNKPDADVIEKICNILKISPNDLLDWKESNVTLAAHRTDGYDNDLPEEAQKELENYIGYLKTKYKKK